MFPITRRGKTPASRAFPGKSYQQKGVEYLDSLTVIIAGVRGLKQLHINLLEGFFFQKCQF